MGRSFGLVSSRLVGGLPAITKGFIDRLFLPGMAFKYKENSVWWDKLLKNKTAHIITTLDQPGWYYWLFYGRPSINQLKKITLEFCGIKPVKVTYVGIIKTSDGPKRMKWLEKIQLLGQKQNKKHQFGIYKIATIDKGYSFAIKNRKFAA
jgi:putative NADPH-quinone reductase